jgi:NhaP-type Na+/H+ or K+/H+ antiporter
LSALNIALAVVGSLVLIIGLFSEPIKRSLLSAPLIALAVGVLLGPAVFGMLDPSRWGKQEIILEEAARLTLAIALMGVALRLPAGYPLSRWRSMAVMLGLVMPLMWLASGLLTFLILGLPFWVALLIGAVITPTDPVLASTIVQGETAQENLPARLRNLLSGESGANDGLAYPLVFLPILLLERPPGEALGHWATYTLLWEVVAAIFLGALVGYGAGRILRWATQKGNIGEPSYLAYTVALALLVLGGAKLLGTDGILAVFAAGVAFSTSASIEAESQEEHVQEAVNRFFILPIFVLLGMALPWDERVELGWAGLILIVAVLLLRRLPAVLALNPLVDQTRGLKDALFLGWFGPIGVAALYYATLAPREAGVEEVWAVGSLIITASIIAHGMSAGPLTRLYGKRAQNEASGE